MVNIKSDREIELMKEACKITAETHSMLEKNIKVGMSTYDLDKMAEEFIKSKGGIPAQKGYPSGIKGVPDFPSTLCISINDEVIHGIPSKKRIIQDGDVVSIDLVVLKNGFHGDSARTHLVGNCSEQARKLVEVTKQAFFEGIKFAREGNRVGDISFAVEEYVKQFGFSVVKEFQGHGIGREMHEEPGVPNYGKKGKGMRLQKGMTIAVEPMVIQGNPEIFELEDGWTIVTEDGSLAAHYENTILITEKEAKVLTII